MLKELVFHGLDAKMVVHQPDEEELTPRQRDILGIVIREYINTAVPVGSLTIAQSYPLGVSPATIRNELASLEEMGYLVQPHTSAGRMPTEKGYRYFVTRLMEEVELPLVEQLMIRHQFHQARMDLEQWMRLAAAVLAHATKAASLVTAPRAAQARLKHLELISVSDTVNLIVLVLHGGTVRQEMISLPLPILQEEAERISNKLNALFQGWSAAEIETKKHALPALERALVERVLNMMWDEEGHRSSTLYWDGLIHVLQQPEFAEVSRMLHMLQILGQHSLLEPMLEEATEQRGIQVIIGGEGRWEEMADLSLVLAPYGVLDRAAGALGVLGPLRMPYHRAMSVVRYMAQLLSELISDLH